nr:CapA family protein [Proteus mirabilis]
MQYIGAGENIYQARKPIILKIDKHNVALLAYNCYSTNSAMNADYSSFGQLHYYTTLSKKILTY